MAVYYNEIDLYAAEWLRNLIKAGHIADGEVDTRSIVDVQPDDLRSFSQCHFFAGIAGWSHALRLAGWEDDRRIWTGSCPCQPFSVAGQGKGTDDPRHLWPHFFRLIRGCRPPVVMGEQVAGAAGYVWLDGVRSDLESESYSCNGVDIPACAANAPHIRQRLYWCAVVNSYSERRQEHGGPVSVQTEQSSVECSSSRWTESGTRLGPDTFDMADAECRGRESWSISASNTTTELTTQKNICCSNFWHDAIWLNGADGKTRRAGTDIRMLVDGFSASLGRLCPDKYAEAQQKVIDYASSIQTSPEETMREVWEYVWQEPEAVRPVGQCAGIYTQEILLAFLCQLSSACGASREFISCKETEKDELRSLRDRSETSCTSCERQSIGQSSRKYSDALHELSWVLAQYAGEMWEAHKRENAKPLPLLMHGVPARVGKLRAYGNAIVPQVAAEVIRAFMSVYP